MSDYMGLAGGVASSLVFVGIAWGVFTSRVGRLERDVEARATVERVSALERRVDDIHNGIEKKLDKIESTLEALRADLGRR